MENPNKTIDDIIKKMKSNRRRTNTGLIMKAYNFAEEHHRGQKRMSGEDYIIHPLNVAYILADLHMDDATICAALLHDVVEDTQTTNEDIVKNFGTEIAEMVAGVTKLSKIRYVTIEEEQVENYRKMFLAMGKDIRVILIKLADRLHNMRTLSNLKRERQIANAKETMELYAPLANRLGIYSLKWELEDLAFKYLYPEEYRELVMSIEKKREERIEFIEKIMEDQKQKDIEKGRIGRKIRAMILGIPNVGKSSFINRISKRTTAGVGNKPGVTKQKQWIRINEKIELLDTPGVLWPKFESEEVALNLAYTGTIKEEILQRTEIAYQLTKFLLKNYPQNLYERYNLEKEKIEAILKQDQPENFNIYEVMLEIGRKRGCIISGGNIDEEKTSRIILDE